ncbi:hypothetical protein QBC46DRAFT_396270 [Diplogelasinospora grovesii]|uniref:Uncharacterized protein n=1 Tax=Diplogelasinospora grovesii TaxID=303347 RepID=A0AAN6N0H6_9PEZI|nr:hypothetical protein QBC46DRAFT_396270 [Diplogelasinospora grovesii]
MNEFGDKKEQYGCYDWLGIHDADTKLRALKTGQGQDVGDHVLEGEVGYETGQGGSSK